MKKLKDLPFQLMVLSSLTMMNTPVVASSIYEENSIVAIHYRNPAGGYMSSIGFTKSLSDTSTQDNSGRTTADYSYGDLETDLSLDYGVSDAIGIGISENYLWYNTEYDNLYGGQEKSLGPSNPTVHVNYRFLGALSGDSFATGFLYFTPRIGSAKLSDANHDGNNFGASSSLRLGANYFAVLDATEWQVGGEVAGYTKGAYINQTTNETRSERASYATEDLFTRIRFHFKPDWFGQMGLTYTLPYSVNYKYVNAASNSASDNVQQVDGHIVSSLVAGYAATESVLASIRYSFSRVARHNDYSGGASYREVQNTVTATRSYVDIGADYIF